MVLESADSTQRKLNQEPLIISVPTTKLDPQVVGGYRMIKLLGRGTMGQVYLAEQVSMQRPVALKILSPFLAKKNTFVQRFFNEARAVARLNHPNIVTAIDVGEMDSVYYLAMEFIDGVSLDKMFTPDCPLDEDRSIAIIRQVLAALEHANNHNVIHRDIKPENIMICKDGRVKVADLGLSILTDAPIVYDTPQNNRQIVGTPYYMSPEQVEHLELDWRSDQYSLAVTLYEAVTGVKPFGGNTTTEILSKRLYEDPKPAFIACPKVSRQLSAILSKMMSRFPEQRYQSFADLKADFKIAAQVRGHRQTSFERIRINRSTAKNKDKIISQVLNKISWQEHQRLYSFVAHIIIGILLVILLYILINK